MKKLIFILVMFLSSCGIFINPVYNKLSDEEKEFYNPDTISEQNKNINQKGKVYPVNKNILEGLIKNSDIKYHLVVLYAVWCSPCRKELPEILNYFEKKNVTLYFITSDDWRYIENVKNYWNKTNYNDATYILDIYEYKHKNSLRSGINVRNKVFLNSLCFNCSELGGYPIFILFNNDFEVIFKKAGTIENFNITFDQIIK